MPFTPDQLIALYALAGFCAACLVWSAGHVLLNRSLLAAGR